jgi:hypothetical protein
MVVFSGCAPMAEIDIRVMDPAEVTLPEHIQQLAFMNRSIDPYVLRSDTLKWTREEYQILDSIMHNWIFKGVSKIMDQSPLFELDTITVILSRRYDTTDLLKPLSKEALEKLKELQSADAVLSLEYYNIIDSVDVYTELGEGFFRTAYLGLTTTTVWRIYDLVMDTVFDEYVQRDTATWYASGDYTEEAVALLPRLVVALRIAALEVGQRYGFRISPGWMEAPRFYYRSGSEEMRIAWEKAASGDWNGAAEIWKVIAYQEDEKTAARASFNMALACEMEDLLLPALDWIIKSYSIQQKSLTLDYLKVLQKRYKDRKKLERQLPEIIELEQ